MPSAVSCFGRLRNETSPHPASPRSHLRETLKLANVERCTYPTHFLPTSIQCYQISVCPAKIKFNRAGASAMHVREERILTPLEPPMFALRAPRGFTRTRLERLFATFACRGFTRYKHDQLLASNVRQARSQTESMKDLTAPCARLGFNSIFQPRPFAFRAFRASLPQ